MTHAATVTRTLDDVRAIAKNRRLAPTREEARKFGREREELNPATGKREWVVDLDLTTKRGRDGAASMRPFMKAEAERGAEIRSRDPKPVVLVDANGQRHGVDPRIADKVARKNRWRVPLYADPRWRVMEGAEGMLFIREHGGWRPSGRWCLSRPWTLTNMPANGRRDGSMKCKGLQHDPSGRPWRGVGGKWVAL